MALLTPTLSMATGAQISDDCNGRREPNLTKGQHQLKHSLLVFFYLCFQVFLLLLVKLATLF